MALLVEIGAKVDGLMAGLNQAKTQMQGFARTTQGITQNMMSGNVAGVFEQISTAVAAGGSVLLGFTGIVAGLGVAMGVVKTMQFAKEMDQVAEASGFSVKQVFELQRALERQGISLEQLAPMMAKARMEIENLKDPMSRASLALKQLGLGSNDFTGKTNMQVLQVLSQAEAKAKDAGKFLAATSQLFGLEKGGKMAIALKGENLEQSKERANPAASIIQDAAPVFMKVNATLIQIKDSFLAIGEVFFGKTATIWLTLLEDFANITKNLYKVGEFLANVFIDAVTVFSTYLTTFADTLAAVIGLAVKELANGMITAGLKLKNLLSGIFDIEGTPEQEAEKKKKQNEQIAGYMLDTGEEKQTLNNYKDIYTKKKGEDTVGGIPRSLFDEVRKTFSNSTVTDENLPKIPPSPAAHPIRPIVSELTKAGGGGFSFGADVTLDVQRQQLIQQTRMANAMERFIGMVKPASNPMIGISPDFQIA